MLTDLAATIRDSALLLGLLSGAHLVGFTLIMGSVLISTLRLAGLLLADRDVVDVTRPAARGVAIGLVISVVTGALLFAPRAAEVILNNTFRVKMLLLGAAAAFQFTIHRAVCGNPAAQRSAQRMAGAIALLLWSGVAVAGAAFILLE